MKDANITQKITLEIAELARLHLTQEEVENYTIQMNEILKYVAVLESVEITDTTVCAKDNHSAAPTLELVAPLREDNVNSDLHVNLELREHLLKCAPELKAECFQVPPVL